MTVPNYQPATGCGSWDILTRVDAIMSSLDPLPFQRNASARDQWTRTKGVLSPTASTPQNHLEYNLQIQSLIPTGTVTGEVMELEATLVVAFCFLVSPDPAGQWAGHLLALLAAQSVRRSIMAGSALCSVRGAVARVVDVNDSFQPAAPPVEQAGILVTQTYRIRYSEGIA